MNVNLLKRIITSLILLFILFVSLFLNKILWIYLLIAVSIISFYEFNNLIKKSYKRKKNKIYLFNLISFLYLSFFIFTAYDIHSNSVISLLFIILICVFSDTGGYVVGKLIGGKKLTKISPNKTVSGCIGSFLFSLFPVLIFEMQKNINFQLVDHNIISLILICLFLSLICQLGDLFISFFKRKAKTKDTGTILPGHGGLLDRIDGFIFVLPSSFVLIELIY
jgi:phosphatidate cytidylyltransferase